jgi:hypothetical protein
MVRRIRQKQLSFVVDDDVDDDDVEGDDGGAAQDESAPLRSVVWPIQIAKAERTIFELHRSWKNGILYLSPDFQRELIWDRRRKVRLVESVLARIPLPVFYLSEENEDQTIIIDGQQRLNTLFDFKDNNLELRDLVLLPEHNDKYFDHLDGKLQRRFENTPLTCFIVQPGTGEDVKFQIFERLNEGAIALNAQEIRNSVYRGPGLEMVKRLASDTSPNSFRDVAGAKRGYRRMKADELVLRCLAFLDLGLAGYSGQVKNFLNRELKRLNTMTPKERQILEVRLCNALRRTKAVFGEHAFCRYDPEADKWSTQMNGPLMETIICGFDQYFPENRKLPRSTARAIFERFKNLCGNGPFRDSITFATQPPETVKLRFSLWIKELADVAAHHP